MRENFLAIVKLIGIAEGGFANNPKDPGGATMKGVTLKTYSAYRKRKGLANPTVADLKRIADVEVIDIFRSDYWAPVHGDELPAGVDLCVADFSFNSGAGQAMTELQRVVTALGFDTEGADGKFGSHTAAALIACMKAKGEDILISKYQAKRLAFMQSLKTWPSFKNGWSTRVAEVRANALNLAHGDPTFAPTPFTGSSKAEPAQASAIAVPGSRSTLTTVGGSVAAAATAGGQQLLQNSSYQPPSYLVWAILGFLALSVVAAGVTYFVLKRQPAERGVL